MFPQEIDADGDGIVYFLFPADWDGRYTNASPVDGAAYEQWSKGYLDAAEEIPIATQKLTEESIAALGCPRPDIPPRQPVG